MGVIGSAWVKVRKELKDWINDKEKEEDSDSDDMDFKDFVKEKEEEKVQKKDDEQKDESEVSSDSDEEKFFEDSIPSFLGESKDEALDEEYKVMLEREIEEGKKYNEYLKQEKILLEREREEDKKYNEYLKQEKILLEREREEDKKYNEYLKQAERVHLRSRNIQHQISQEQSVVQDGGWTDLELEKGKVLEEKLKRKEMIQWNEIRGFLVSIIPRIGNAYQGSYILKALFKAQFEYEDKKRLMRLVLPLLRPKSLKDLFRTPEGTYVVTALISWLEVSKDFNLLILFLKEIELSLNRIGGWRAFIGIISGLIWKFKDKVVIKKFMKNIIPVLKELIGRKISETFSPCKENLVEKYPFIQASNKASLPNGSHFT